MSSGSRGSTTVRSRAAHRTASIRRMPRAEHTPTAPRRRTDRLDDLTRGIPADKQLLSGPRKRALVTLLGVAVLGVLAALMFVLPVKWWIHQSEAISTRQHELDVIRDANSRLDAEIARLKTAEGIRQAARDELGWVDRSETQYRIVDDPNGSMILPSGWPFDALATVLTARGAVLDTK